MANTPKPKLPIQVVFAILLVVTTTLAIVIVFVPKFLPATIKPIPVTLQAPTITPSIFPKQAFTETAIVPTDTPNPSATSTFLPTDTPAATFTPNYTSTTHLFPDLTVTGISDPACIKDRGSPQNLYVELSFIVRNIGLGSTRPFGPFSVSVNLILGQRRYSLDEWASGFNGVLGSSNMNIENLGPNRDVKLNLSIDLKGNTSFGVEVIANSGTNTIPETNTTNNTLIRGFSVTCS